MVVWIHAMRHEHSKDDNNPDCLGINKKSTIRQGSGNHRFDARYHTPDHTGGNLLKASLARLRQRLCVFSRL